MLGPSGHQMVLKTTRISANRKTGPIAVTNRSGKQNIFGTCPDSCKLMLPGYEGSDRVDTEYLHDLRKAVPKRGKAWTYTHSIAYRRRFRPSREGETCINSSCDTIDDIKEAQYNGHPSVTVIPDKSKHAHIRKLREEGISVGICPAQVKEGVTCSTCGNGTPWCSMHDRHFTVGFISHGPGTNAASDCEKKGGCYAAYNFTRIHWNKLAQTEEQEQTDGEQLRKFAKTLPPGSLLRHHVVGDMMKDEKSRHFEC